MDQDELDFFRHLKREENAGIALNLLKSLEDRSLGHLKKNVKAKECCELYAEDEFLRKDGFDELRCDVPGMPKSTFLMSFSPDGTKVASTHGNHNIYITDLRNGKNIKTLVGHPRTPWCLAFHPTSNQIIASGCLGGQVRIWDLSGGSEVWTSSNQSVIASIAFHPNDRILVIATVNEVYFWDWSKPEPFCSTATGNQKEKVRYVAFDKLGHKLITGISNSPNRWDYSRSSIPVSRHPDRPTSPYRRRNLPVPSNYLVQNTVQASPSNTPREPLSSVPERERNITACYRNLVREYGRLVQRYLQLYRPPAMIDRGTDPMDQSNSPRQSTSNAQMSEPSTSSEPGPSRSVEDGPPISNPTIPSCSNENPYQLLTPSRILAVINKPTTLIRGTQTTESRKHKVDSSKKNTENSKRMKTSTDSSVDTSSNQNESEISPDNTNSPEPSTSGLNNLNNRQDRVHILEDIIRSSPLLNLKDDVFEMPSYSRSSNFQSSQTENKLRKSNLNCPSSSSSTNEISSLDSSSRNTEPDSSTQTPESTSCSSFSSLLPKPSKGKQKYLQKHEILDGSSSDSDDQEENVTETTTPVALEPENVTLNPDSTEDLNENEVTTSSPDVFIDPSMPSTSRSNTERQNNVEETQRLESMMMNIRKNAEQKLISRFLPIINSMPENHRLELTRLFEQGIKESREKARVRYKNMFNKKINRRATLETSSDSSSSDDETDLRNTDINQFFQNETSEQTENQNTSSSNIVTESTQRETESDNRNSTHNINNLENLVTSLFDDAAPSNSATAPVSNVTTQATTSSSTSTVTDSSVNLTSRLNRTQNLRKIYARMFLRNRVNSSTSPTNTSSNTSSSPNSTPNSNIGPTNTRTAPTNYSFSRRRIGSNRLSAFLPTRAYYPRVAPESRRNRLIQFGRWRSNQRLFRSHNIGNRPIPNITLNNSSNFASDEVINFSELPNSEDDPIPSFERRSSTPPHFPYQYHPFNPPPDLPTINPENIGIGNMYSNIVQDLETSLNDVRNIRAANRPGEMSDMLSNFSERLENIMNQSETILRNLRSSVDMLPGNETREGGSVPTAIYNDANFYIRENRTERNDVEHNINSILGEDSLNNITSDHTYPRNSDSSIGPQSSNESMSPLMTSLHLTISHIQRQARLLRQQVESIERIDRAMVEVAQLQLMRLLLVELTRYVRNMSGESRSTCMSSVRQMMAGTRISDSSPGESQNNDNDNNQPSTSQPSTSNTSSDTNSMPSTRIRGVIHKTYPPSRLSRIQRQYYRRATFIHHIPRRHVLRAQTRNATSMLSSSVSLNLDSQSMLNMYSRINSFTLTRMSRWLEEYVDEQVVTFMHRSYFRVPPRTPRVNTGEQNLAIRLRDSISRTNRLVGSIFDANVVRNYRMDTAAISRGGVDRFYARQTLSIIIDGISSHLDETRGSSLPYNIRLQLQGVMTISMLLSELLLLHIVDSIPPPTDMNLDQERQSLTNRIDQMCTTMMMSSRYGGYSIHLTNSLRQLQTMIRQNSNVSSNVSPNHSIYYPANTPLRRRPDNRFRTLEARSRSLYRISALNRDRNIFLPSRAQETPDHLSEIELSSSDMQNNVHPVTFSSSSSQDANEDSNQNQERVRSMNENSEQPASRERTNLRTRLANLDDALNRCPQINRLGRTIIGALAENFLRSQPNDNAGQTENVEQSDPQIASTSSGVSGSRDNIWNRLHQDPPIEDVTRDENPSNNSDTRSAPNNSFTLSPHHSTSMHANRRFHSTSTIGSLYRSPSTLNSSVATSSNSEEWSGINRWPWNVPSVQVNDVPVSELGPSQESSESDNPTSRNAVNNNNNNVNPSGLMGRWAAIRANHPLGMFRPRFLHPLYASVNPFDADLDDPHREHIYDSDVITTVTPNHRIQVWDISESEIPSISNPLKNVVVSECKIHNDASVDIASDGSILVTLLPSGGYLNVTNRLGIYSLKWETLGQCLYTTNFDHNAVSVSLSPLSRHLVVGLASRRVSIVPSERWMMARIFRIDQKDIPGDRLPVVRDLGQNRDGRGTSHKSINSIKWLPTSGQGLIYATNTGQLVILT